MYKPKTELELLHRNVTVSTTGRYPDPLEYVDPPRPMSYEEASFWNHVMGKNYRHDPTVVGRKMWRTRPAP